MVTPDDHSDAMRNQDIADTGTFQRFVEHEREMEVAEAAGTARGRWIAIGAIVAIIVIAVVIWALIR